MLSYIVPCTQGTATSSRLVPSLEWPLWPYLPGSGTATDRASKGLLGTADFASKCLLLHWVAQRTRSPPSRAWTSSCLAYSGTITYLSSSFSVASYFYFFFLHFCFCTLLFLVPKPSAPGLGAPPDPSHKPFLLQPPSDSSQVLA